MAISSFTSSGLYTPLVYEGLEGVGNWAYVTATTGSPTTGTYTDANSVEWKWYRWTSAGSVTTTAGAIDILVVGGGSGSWATVLGPGRVFGSGGKVIDGVRGFTAATHTVTVGAAGGDAVTGKSSVLGSFSTGEVAYGSVVSTTSSITGTSIAYSGTNASPVANRGHGQENAGAGGGSSGVVIIRVPSIYALA